MASPLKMSYKGGVTPKGVPGVSMGQDGKKGSTPTKIMKGVRSAGEMYKSPGSITLRGKNATDKSSGQSLPTKQSASDKKRYVQASQPTQFSNGSVKATKFVC